MQVEKDIAIARDFIEGNVYEKTGYRKVKLFSDQSLKSFKKRIPISLRIFATSSMISYVWVSRRLKSYSSCPYFFIKSTNALTANE